MTPFSIVYTKTPNHTVDLLILPISKSRVAENLADRITKTLVEVKTKLEEANAKYKLDADKHRRSKNFNVGDLVMVHLRKERFPLGTYNKLRSKKFGPYRIKREIGDNAYVLELPADLHISPTSNITDLYEYFPPDDAPVIIDNSGASSS
ncbi:hypothetical protein PanWU01x14_145870 [Parasponia andersonii]|uniref:Tf2-1-like SH3-like domain-containing protein n=1 Tax=Parasponia andersonii TaxID=3476 RepID=A0A2P5CK92_PARAD|nr:hypothetical protein PanWU01x14_145870 [Parasponia andersonii]